MRSESFLMREDLTTELRGNILRRLSSETIQVQNNLEGNNHFDGTEL